MEELLQQFPGTTRIEPSYRSFVYQPERISINSRQSLLQTTLINGNNQPEFYYQFENELRNPLLRIKRMELLRATIPNAVTSIPLTQGVFFYYRIPALNAPEDYAPDYSLLEPTYIHMVRLLPQTFYDPDFFEEPELYGYNKTFNDYEDLVAELNKSTLNDPDFDYPTWQPFTVYPAESYVVENQQRYYTANGSAGTENFNTDAAFVKSDYTPFIPKDITFSYNETLNKIVLNGNNYYDTVNNQPQYYYLPVGYSDPNLAIFVQQINQELTPQQFPTNLPYTLNRRLGFLWAGIYNFNNADIDPVIADLQYHTIPTPNWVTDYTPLLPNYTAEGYADLVNTANVFVYCDFVGGSTQDTNTDERLLAVIPMNASNLGVSFGESKIVCPLSKVSENIYRIMITLRTDTTEPFYLPTNAYVNLEIKVEYE